MNRRTFPTWILLIALLAACAPNTNGGFQLQVIETSSETHLSQEVIQLNNCGGTADVEQVSEHTQSIELSELNNTELQMLIADKYIQTQGIAQSLKLVAPPGTKMQYTLKWTEQVALGEIHNFGVAGEKTASYRVSTPLTVELVSSTSIPCSAESTPAAGQEPTAPAVFQSQLIGFNFAERKPGVPDGDRTAADHLFIHPYHAPRDGYIIGATWLDDHELDPYEFPESILVLILHPVKDGYIVIGQFELTDDTQPQSDMYPVLILDAPIPVQKGDIFAHWQAQTTGPIPFNLDGTAIQGASQGQFGFDRDSLAVGKLIRNAGFSGNRDYFINLLFSPTP